jgi:hypothetical protein
MYRTAVFIDEVDMPLDHLCDFDLAHSLQDPLLGR